MSDRLVELAALGQISGQALLGEARAGIGLGGLAVSGNRLVELAGLGQRHGQVAPGGRVGRLQFGAASEMDQSLVEIALVDQHAAQQHVGSGIVGINGDRLLEAGLRLGKVFPGAWRCSAEQQQARARMPK